MLEIYRRDRYTGHVTHIRDFKDLDALCHHFYPRDKMVDIFGYTGNYRNGVSHGVFGEDRERIHPYIEPTVNYKYVVYDHKGKIITPDHIVGHFRNYWINYKFKCKRPAWRRQAWSGYRGIRTTNEKRQAFDTYVEEYGIFVRPRGKRNTTNLPDGWDDYRAHNDKSWKTQSKRTHQWK